MTILLENFATQRLLSTALHKISLGLLITAILKEITAISRGIGKYKKHPLRKSQ